MAGESYLVDKNVLLRLADAASLQHGVVTRALAVLTSAGSPLYVTAQNLIEFWAVATRPQSRNGFGLAPAQADARIGLILTQFDLLSDRPEIFLLWRILVRSVGVSGTQVHDARLVAVMQAHTIDHILTFNGADFARYMQPAGIVVVDPASI